MLHASEFLDLLTLEQEELAAEVVCTRNWTLQCVTFAEKALGSLGDETVSVATEVFNTNVSHHTRSLIIRTPGRRSSNNSRSSVCGSMSRTRFGLGGTDEDSSRKTTHCSKRCDQKLSVVHGLSLAFCVDEVVDFVSGFFDDLRGGSGVFNNSMSTSKQNLSSELME